MRFADNKLKAEIENYNIKSKYDTALLLLQNSKKISDFENVKKLFNELHNYKDSMQKADLCRARVDWLKKDYGYIIFSLKNKIKENSFSIIINDNLIHSGRAGAGTIIEQKLKPGNYVIKILSDYFTSNIFNVRVDHQQKTVVEITKTVFGYSISR